MDRRRFGAPDDTPLKVEEKDEIFYTYFLHTCIGLVIIFLVVFCIKMVCQNCLCCSHRKGEMMVNNIRMKRRDIEKGLTKDYSKPETRQCNHLTPSARTTRPASVSSEMTSSTLTPIAETHPQSSGSSGVSRSTWIPTTTEEVSVIKNSPILLPPSTTTTTAAAASSFGINCGDPRHDMKKWSVVLLDLEPSSGSSSDDEEVDDDDPVQFVTIKTCYGLDTVIRQIEAAIRLMEDSKYFQHSLNSIELCLLWKLQKSLYGPKGIKRIVCYGLGSLTEVKVKETPHRPPSNQNSIYQFAFLICLQKRLGVVMDLFDPLFGPMDHKIISQIYSFHIPPHNEKGRRTVMRELTLFYLPHCHPALTNGVLHANWCPDSLQNVVLIANEILPTPPLTSSNDYDPHPELTSYIKKVQPKTVRWRLGHPFFTTVDQVNGFVEAFEGLCIHIFPPKNFDGVGSKFWRIDQKFEESQIEVFCAH